MSEKSFHLCDLDSDSWPVLCRPPTPFGLMSTAQIKGKAHKRVIKKHQEGLIQNHSHGLAVSSAH